MRAMAVTTVLDALDALNIALAQLKPYSYFGLGVRSRRCVR